MVIIKCNLMLPTAARRRLEINLHEQAADGLIVLPCYCELLQREPGDGIKIVYEDEVPET